MRSTLLVTVLVILVAFAGCIGGSTDAPGDGGSNGDGADGTDGDGSSPPSDDNGPSGDGDGNGDGGTGGNGDGDGGAQDGPRTPSDAMDQEPAETGEGWARFDLNGTADFAVQVSVVPADQGNYSFPLQIQDDVVRVEAALTWEGGFTDLNLFLTDAGENPQASSAHGAEDIPGVLLVTPSNGTTWEYFDVGAETLEAAGPGVWTIRVQEYNNLTPEGVQASAGVGEGTPFALSVWVYTVDTGMSNHPAGG